MGKPKGNRVRKNFLLKPNLDRKIKLIAKRSGIAEYAVMEYALEQIPDDTKIIFTTEGKVNE